MRSALHSLQSLSSPRSLRKTLNPERAAALKSGIHNLTDSSRPRCSVAALAADEEIGEVGAALDAVIKQLKDPGRAHCGAARLMDSAKKRSRPRRSVAALAADEEIGGGRRCTRCSH